MCAAGLHHDATDAFGGYSPTCTRCDRPVHSGATPEFRGTCMSAIGVVMILIGVFHGPDFTNELLLSVLGSALFLGGAVMVWKKVP